MTFPITTSTATPVGVVRLLIPDKDTAAPVFTDAEIAAFLTLDGSVRLAAALALDVIASDEAMISKVIKTQDLGTNGPAVAAELRARAEMLRAQEDAAIERASGGITIVNFDRWYYPAELTEQLDTWGGIY